MNNFNLHRFAMLLKRDLLGEWKRNLKNLSYLYIGCLLVEFVLFYDASRMGRRLFVENPGAETVWLEELAGNFVCLLFFILIAGISTMFACLKTKEERTSYLTFPATNAEKFISRYVQGTLIYVVAYLVAFMAADLTRMALFPLLGHGFGSLIPAFFRMLFDSGVTYGVVNWDHWSASPGFIDELIFLILGYLFLHSLYLLGAAYFRRYPAILTTLLLIAAFFAASLLIKDGWLIWKIRNRVHKEVIMRAFDAFFFIGTVCCYALAYRKFKRIGIINRKLLDL